jgi:hypothetical protein
MRHNVAGDFPSNQRGKIHATKLRALYRAVAHLSEVFTYTHHDAHDPHNAKLLREAIDSGLTVNVSTETHAQADAAIAAGFPVVTLMREGSPRTETTEGGNTIAQCPAQYRDDITCASCMLCARPNRRVVVGFVVHGPTKRYAEALMS